MPILTEGDKAPAFSGVDQNDNKISLADYKGKKLVLYFYLKMTPQPARYKLVTCVIIIVY